MLSIFSIAFSRLYIFPFFKVATPVSPSHFVDGSQRSEPRPSFSFTKIRARFLFWSRCGSLPLRHFTRRSGLADSGCGLARPEIGVRIRLRQMRCRLGLAASYVVSPVWTQCETPSVGLLACGFAAPASLNSIHITRRRKPIKRAFRGD